MSINHFIDENQTPKLDIYANNIQAKKVSVEEEFDELKFKCQNGDVVNLSSLNNYGNGGNVLVSDGNGTISWVEGVPSSSVDYNGNDPVGIGKLAIYGATNGKLIKDSNLSDTDILNKNGDTMNGSLNMNNNNIDNVGIIQANEFYPNSNIDPFSIGFSADNVSFNTINTTCNGQAGQEITWRFTRQGVNYGEFGTENGIFYFGNFNNPAVNTEIRGANGEKLVIDDSTPTPECRLENLDLNLTNNNINNVSNVDTGILTTDTLSSNNPSIDVLFTDLNLNNGDILGVSNTTSGVINCLTMNSTDAKFNNLNVNANFDMKSNNISNVSTLDVDIIQSGNPSIDLLNNIDMNLNNIERVFNIDTGSISSTQGSIFVNDNMVLNNNNITAIDNTDTTRLTINTTTKYISNVSQLPTAVGGFHLLEDNTSYIICGQITLTNGIQYGNNCSLSGVDFSASITFDETANDIVGFKSVDTNVYLSKLTIIGGGGRFSGVPSFSTGLFNCDDFDVAGGFPFYARNRRFKVDGCNFITPYSMGRVRGYATLNFNNNLITGTGAFNTYEGLEVIDGLSLEFLGNKIVLFRGGADPNSTAKMLRFGASIVVPVIPQKPEGLMGFNAINVSGNILHPRGNFENGIDVSPTSRCGLGVISSNTFIRSGGTAPLINYENVALYDNYNPFSIETYTISSNVGIVSSEPNLKSIIQLSNVINSTTLTKLVCQDNNQIEPIQESSRFAIRLDLTGVSVAFVGNERITDDASGNDALILKADTLTAGNQTIYITDMSGKFNATPTTFTGSISGASTGGSLLFYWVYLEKDPRRLQLSANFDLNVGNNVGFSVAPNMAGMADALCSVSSVSASSGAGSTLSVVCSKRYNEGDFVEFYASSTSGNINLVKAVISIK